MCPSPPSHRRHGTAQDVGSIGALRFLLLTIARASAVGSIGALGLLTWAA
eukprot:NODE_3345_length_798_cov_222.503365.p8 GENE.NODE_3345_length_798_cov_222.503365~~NODE_3345_length_798_cov_222.503365.p8  ORF type:complete len:50 (-),score=3.12 NODE_3345_length_798_cov_222.503365:105-254(-)